MPVAGQIVGSRYRLVRPLGEGGMASVWVAEHMTMGNLVAVKIISPVLLKHEEAIARFNREARAAAKLKSPHVVQMYDHDVDTLLGPYIAMELLEGESLAERLHSLGTLSPPDLCRIMFQVAKGLTRAHGAGIVHRDLKPDNIFLAIDDDAEETAKILDFGVAKADAPPTAGKRSKTIAGTLLGTLNYMSPEQAQGREVNHLSDLWSLGVLAFEALVGARPFEEEAPGALVMQICADPLPVPSARNRGVPQGFDDWFAKACAREPAKRFQTSQELAESLAHVCEADELSIEDVLAAPLPSLLPVKVPADVPSKNLPRDQEHGTKKRVLQLVDSTPPPPLPDDLPPARPALPSETMDLDVDFDRSPDYFVTHGGVTVGPVTLETLRVGYQAGYLTTTSLIWTTGWATWRKADNVFAVSPKQPRHRPAPNLELIGRIVDRPSNAPPPPPSPPPPVTEVRPATGKPREPSYFVYDGIIVGPVKASLLRRGVEQGKVSPEALVWRDGWLEWKILSQTTTELEVWRTAPLGMLRSRPGVEAVGMKTQLPADAPAIHILGRSNGAK